MISRIEQGEGCSLDTVEALAKALRVGAADLFDDRDGKDVPHFKPAAMRVARLLSEADEETLEAVLKVAQVLRRRSRSWDSTQPRTTVAVAAPCGRQQVIRRRMAVTEA